MYEIKIAKSAGFCFGVDRAIKLVYKEIEKNKKVVTLGPIIHNKDVVNDLEQKSVKIIEDLNNLKKDETLIIRSHGVSKDIYCKLNELGNNYVDATCPFVARIHKIVNKETEDGNIVLVAGDKNHPEVQGIIGHCGNNCYVFSNENEFLNIFEKKLGFLEKKVAIVAQTTYNIIVWNSCINKIPDAYKNVVKVYNTICDATSTRQSDAIELAKNFDIVIVIGGKHSSNTIKLYNVCSMYCKTYHSR